MVSDEKGLRFDRKYTSFSKTGRKLVLSSHVHSFSHTASNTIFMFATPKCQPLAHTGFLSSRSIEPFIYWVFVPQAPQTKHFQKHHLIPQNFLFYFVSQRSDSHSHSFSPFSKLKKSPDAFNFLSVVTPGDSMCSTKR